mmetsp:Transcript_13992/g.24786  ORF Transcript_13992/g.24786 Transcript_13992/m.24786 type:complete len:125 (-) Transcript_13992:423-797(-)
MEDSFKQVQKNSMIGACEFRRQKSFFLRFSCNQVAQFRFFRFALADGVAIEWTGEDVYHLNWYASKCFRESSTDPAAPQSMPQRKTVCPRHSTIQFVVRGYSVNVLQFVKTQVHECQKALPPLW